MTVTPLTVRALPHRGDVVLGRDVAGRVLRVSGHPECDRVVLSIWQGPLCVATLRLAPEDVPHLVATLVRSVLPDDAPEVAVLGNVAEALTRPASTSPGGATTAPAAPGATGAPGAAGPGPASSGRSGRPAPPPQTGSLSTLAAPAGSPLDGVRRRTAAALIALGSRLDPARSHRSRTPRA